jgi:hypothetical protein
MTCLKCKTELVPVSRSPIATVANSLNRKPNLRCLDCDAVYQWVKEADDYLRVVGTGSVAKPESIARFACGLMLDDEEDV